MKRAIFCTFFLVISCVSCVNVTLEETSQYKYWRAVVDENVTFTFRAEIGKYGYMTVNDEVAEFDGFVAFRDCEIYDPANSSCTKVNEYPIPFKTLSTWQYTKTNHPGGEETHEFNVWTDQHETERLKFTCLYTTRDIIIDGRQRNKHTFKCDIRLLVDLRETLNPGIGNTSHAYSSRYYDSNGAVQLTRQSQLDTATERAWEIASTGETLFLAKSVAVDVSDAGQIFEGVLESATNYTRLLNSIEPFFDREYAVMYDWDPTLTVLTQSAFVPPLNEPSTTTPSSTTSSTSTSSSNGQTSTPATAQSRTLRGWEIALIAIFPVLALGVGVALTVFFVHKRRQRVQTVDANDVIRQSSMNDIERARSRLADGTY